MLAGGDKDAKMKALEAATRNTNVSPAPTPVARPMVVSTPVNTFSPSQPATTSFAPSAPVVTGYGGKAAPPPAYEPEL
jgi:hypothetical protein